jgi:hypothetical protein
MCVRSKRAWDGTSPRPEPLIGLGKPHPMRHARRVPVPRLTHRLGLSEWDVPARMVDVGYQPSRVRLLLKQHIGAPAAPVVSRGDRISRGQIVAEPPKDKLGVPVHASIDGTVDRIDSDSIWISR